MYNIIIVLLMIIPAFICKISVVIDQWILL